MTEINNRRFNILLAKPGFDDSRSMVVKPDSFTWKDLDPSIASGVLAFRTGQNPPDWVPFVNSALEEKLTGLVNTSNSALVLMPVDGNTFIICFGYARNMLNDECFVRDFGLRVVLNTVDPTKLRSVDASTAENITKHTRAQVSAASPPEEFGLDITRDILRSVAGNPKEEFRDIFGSTITGKDSLHITSDAKMPSLKSLLATILGLYGRDTYKDHFDWVDNIREERDPDIVSQLNIELVSVLNSGSLGTLHLALPEIYNPEEIDCFSYCSAAGQMFDDLKIKDAIETLSLEEVEVETLKNRRVYAHKSDEEILGSWSLMRCIVFELDWNSKRYLLTMGNWYCIEPSFVRKVTNEIDIIADMELPQCNEGMHEYDYNSVLSKSVKGGVLCDGKLIYCEGARTSVELCDVLTQDMELIHVKRKDRSSELSHLFSQGKISAEALLSDETFLAKARGFVKNDGKEPDRYFPKSINQIRRSDYTVVFAIIDTSERVLTQSLPFFSLLNLRQTANTLRVLGYNVAKAKIKVKKNA